MIHSIKYRYYSVGLHALLWSLVLLFPYLVSDAENQYRIGPLPGLYFSLSGIVHMSIFYTNSFLLYPKLLNRTYWPIYMISVVLLLAGSYWFKLNLLVNWFPGAPYDARSHVLFPSVTVFIVSVFYSVTRDKIRAEKKQKEHDALQLEMELKFLRSQISPHFIFNILTNLVYLARKRSADLEPSLLMLSGLIRYMLYEGGKKITLQQEAEYLRNYIALQELRLTAEAKVLVDIDIPPEEESCRIEPMLLIPFIENAFKHGTRVKDPDIEIRLGARGHAAMLQVRNRYDSSLRNAVNDDCSGIGLANVRSRLDLLYRDRHHLAIRQDKSEFNVQLSLKLSK